LRTLGCVLALVGLVGSARTPSDPPPPISLLAQILPDYNARNSAAIAAAGRYDASLWKTAHTAAVLEGDVFSTRYREVFAIAPEQGQGQWVLEPVRQFGDPPSSYPRWVIGAVTQRQEPPSTASTRATTTSATDSTASPSSSPSQSSQVDVAVFEQATDAAAWMMSHKVPVERAALPQDGAGPPATPAQQQAATSLASQLAQWLTSGRLTAGVQPGSAGELRSRATESTKGISRTIGCALYSPSNESGVSDAVRVSRAGAASLVAISISCVTNSRVADDEYLTWNPGWDKLHPTPSHRQTSLRQPWVAMLLVLDPDEGDPAIIGSERSNVL
jgi:hypothetical protein